MSSHLARRELGLGLSAAAIAALLPRPARAAVSLKYGNAGAPQTISNVFAARAFEDVERRTGGEVKVQIFAGTLGGEKTLLDGMALGTIDIYNGAYTGTREFDILYSPYMFRDGAHAGRVMAGPIGEKASKVVEDRYKARLLVAGRLGPYVLAVKRKISSIEEVKGMKIRTPQIEGCVEAVKHLGANPTPVPFNEVYLALQQGLVDGFVSALNASMGSKFYEPCKYLVANEFGQALDKILISTRAWERLSAPQREIVGKTCREMEEREYYRAGLEAMKKDADTWRGYNGPDSIITLDQNELVNRMRPLNERLAAEVFGAGSYEQIQKS